MAEKVLNARLQLKYDTYANWELVKNSFVPKKGEVCFVEVPASAGSGLNEPAILFKVGDGTKTFANLAYGSGKAADVNMYALQDAATFKTTIENWISGKVQDSDTYKEFKIVANGGDGKYKMQERTVDKIAGTTTEWADVTGSTIDVSDAFGRIEELEDLVGGTAVATQISNAIAALDLPNTYAGKAYEGKVTALEGRMTTAEGDIEALEGRMSTAEGNITTLQSDVAAAEGDISDLKTRMVAAEGDISGLDSRLDTAESNITALDGRVDDHEEAIEALDGRLDTAEGNISALQSGKQDNLAFITPYDASTNKVATAKDIEDLGKALKYIGSGELASGETVQEACTRIANDAGYTTLKSGYVVILKISGTNVEFIYNESAAKWDEFGNEGNSYTKAEADAKFVAKETGKSLVDDDEITKLAGVSAGANKVEASDNGYIKIDGAKTKVYEAPAGTVVDANYKHITVTSSSVSDGTNTFNKYDDTALAGRVSQAESDIDALESSMSTAQTDITGLKNRMSSAETNIGNLESSKQDKITSANPLDHSLVSGLGSLATKSSVAKTDLASALKTEIEGKANSADLAAIATSGNVNDLIQSSGDVLVFNCGSSTVNV